MPYVIQLRPAAERDLKKIPTNLLPEIDACILALAQNPRPHGVEKLKGKYGDYYRVHKGDYRILYLIKDRELVICVVRIAHRREVYRKKGGDL